MNKELLEEIKEAFFKEERLIGRLASFFEEYNDFEMDELFINDVELDEIKRKMLKINEKLIANVSESVGKELDILNVVPEDSKVELEIKEENPFSFAVYVEKDGFVIESSHEDEEESSDEP